MEERYLVASMEVDYAFGAACEDLELMPVEPEFKVEHKKVRTETKLQSVANDESRGRGWLKLREGRRKGRGRSLEVMLDLASWPVQSLLISSPKHVVSLFYRHPGPASSVLELPPKLQI